ADPFFFYYASWLVHTPIQARSKALLEKYCAKLGVDYTTDPGGWALEGQKNPYYCAMVETLDHYVGQLVDYLETTDDPRWPGHKLIENTYLIFTSDNGGMEGHPGEIITDNYPLDRGKISAKEGGVRVPFIIAGPGIKAGIESDVVINGTDLYPTIVNWAKAKFSDEQAMDGIDLGPLLSGDATDPGLVKNADGTPRDTMMWHFPHATQESTLRVGGYKLVRNYNKYTPNATEFELYQLYDENNQRVDIEESNNLATADPDRTAAMNQKLTEMLDSMDASLPHLNPKSRFFGPEKERVPAVLKHQEKEGVLIFRFKENGSKVVRANLIYTLNGGAKEEEWYRLKANIKDDQIRIKIPKGTTHNYLNLSDENRFLVSYPEIPTKREGKSFAEFALDVE
ncbi:MAG: sulfatase-like hydrolase/transferase, partial [Verrucomicrobiota bacterium]